MFLKIGLTFDVDRAGLQALLPEGYEVDPEKQPTIMFEVMLLRNLPWLNGRGASGKPGEARIFATLIL